MGAHQLYLKPLHFHEGEGGAGGRLAGGPVRFSHVELISRADGSRTQISYEEAATSCETAIREALEALEEARAPFCGLDLATPRIMGIVNVTPDSFSDGGAFHDHSDAIAQAIQAAEDGAHILDIGGESTRPGSDPVDEATECARILPVIEALAGRDTPISCDTRKASVMRKAIAAGAHIINDISSLTHDQDARPTAAQLAAPVILMHSKGEPKVMQDAPSYGDVCLDVFDELNANIEACVAAGIPRAKIVADPGIGFGKTFTHNLELINDLALFHGLGVALMLGVSRKGFLGALTGVKDARARAVGSVSAALSGLARGVQLFRVHDVKQTAEAFAVWDGIRQRHVP
ncbi:MAG: dihydropteroate synthase [Pseudomonadota bacterium]